MTSQFLKIISLFFFTIPVFALTYKGADGRLLEDSPSVRDYRDIDTLVVGAFNVENLFENSLTDPERNFLEILPRDFAPPKKKTEKHLKDIAKAISDAEFDVFAVEEVENLSVLEKLNKFYLKSQYRPFLIEGNDPRGIDVGFLVKKNLPFYIEERSNKAETWQDPTTNDSEKLLFSRDLPELHVRMSPEAQPMFVFLGTHYKSKIDRPKDPESRILRKAQVERTAEIIERIESEQGENTKIILSGDFNGVATEEPEFTSLQSIEMKDAFDLVSPPLKKEERITHNYFPKGAPVERSQLDAVYVNASMKNSITSGKVYRYKDENGKEIPLPKTYKDKANAPSDHYPVVVKVNFNQILK